MDLITNLPKTSRGNVHTIVAVDSFSKFLEIGPLKGKSSKDVTKWFESTIINRYGKPEIIRTDRETEFLGEFEVLI